MGAIRWMLGGVIGGAVGAALWAALAYFANIEIGWIAWGVGGLVGFGVALGAEGEGSIVAGFTAAVIALLSILGGRYAAINLSAGDYLNENMGEIMPAFTDEFLISYIADGVVAEYEEEGRRLDWPAGADREYPEGREDYPSDVWKDARERWNSLSESEQADFEAQTRAYVESNLRNATSAVAAEAFAASFGFLDIIFFGLAVITAFGIASRGLEG